MKAHLADLGLKPEDVLHTAESLFHDHVPARRHGFANCWIYRRHAQEGFGATMVPGELPPYDFRFNTMARSEEHTSELQSLMRISYAVFCLKQKRLIANKYTQCARVEHRIEVSVQMQTTMCGHA